MFAYCVFTLACNKKGGGIPGVHTLTHLCVEELLARNLSFTNPHDKGIETELESLLHRNLSCCILKRLAPPTRESKSWD